MSNSIVVGDTFIDLIAIKEAYDSYENKHDQLFRVHGALFADPNRIDLPHIALDKLQEAGTVLKVALKRHHEVYLELADASDDQASELYQLCLGGYYRTREMLKSSFDDTMIAACKAITAFCVHAYELVDSHVCKDGMPDLQAHEHRSLVEYYLAVSVLAEEFKDMPRYHPEPSIYHFSKLLGAFVLLLIIGFAMSQGPNYLGCQ